MAKASAMHGYAYVVRVALTLALSSLGGAALATPGEPCVGEGQPCDDDDLCSSDDTCTSGQCWGVAVTCDDGLYCTVDACNPAAGCMYDARPRDGSACHDGDACTSADRCVAGACVGGPPVVCLDDGLACTTHTCDSLLGCQTGFDDARCDDGNACTVDDCDPDAPGGCRHITRPDGVVVASGVPCDGAEQCSNVSGDEVCRGGVPVRECPDYVADIAALGDDVCGAREVAYAIVVDTVTQAPIGTVRCWRERIGPDVVVSCDKVSPESSEARVYEGLYCPGE